MRFGLYLIIALLVSTLTGFAEPWKKDGAKWVHPKGVSFAPPPDVKVETDGKDNSIKMTGTKDDYLMGFFLVDSKATAEKVAKAMKGAMKGITWGNVQNIKTPGYNLVLEEGENRGQTPLGHFSVGYMVKGSKYLVLLASYPATNKKLEQATISSLGSVKFK